MVPFFKRGNQHHTDVGTPDVRPSADRAAEDHGVDNLTNEANLNRAIEKLTKILPQYLIQKRIKVLQKEESLAVEARKQQAMLVELHKTVAKLLAPIAEVLRNPALQGQLDPTRDAVQDVYNAVHQSLIRSVRPLPKISESNIYKDYREDANEVARDILKSTDTALRGLYLELSEWYSGARVVWQQNLGNCWHPSMGPDLIDGLIDDHLRQTKEVAIRIKAQQEQVKQLTAREKHT